MKLKLALCALTVSGSMFMAAQQPATTSPSNSTPPTFPSDQKAPTADQAQQPAIDSQTQSSQVGAQSGSMDQSAGNSKAIEGCLSQATSGSGFILTDASGVAYNLQGDSSDLSSHVGQQVKIMADAAPKSGAASDNSASSSSASTASSAGAAGADASANTLTVKKVKKIASSCSTSQSPSK
jgi:hypothetical protein